MTSTFRCPRGHASAEPDYCDTCGAAISGAPRAEATLAPPVPTLTVSTAAASGSVELCPVCANPRVGSDRFCENDGYDFATGRRPQAAGQAGAATGAAAGPTGQWTAVVAADPGYYARLDVARIAFPSACPSREFTLAGTEMRIGRRRPDTGIEPEIDLSGPPMDPGISHLHAVLTATPSGWTLTDLGSKNGTTINGASEPLKPNTPVPVTDGDRIHLGAWTTISIRASGLPGGSVRD
jgi:FHA domain